MSIAVQSELGRNITKHILMGLTTYNQEVGLFEFGNVVVQKSYLNNQNVRIVSGSRYSIGEFVGKGMLTCAIQGENYMTPPSKVVLRTLRELSCGSAKEIFVICSNNSRNLLNFGLAIERAFNDNLTVKLLPVNDQKNSQVPKASVQSLSGILLLSKVAGAMSERGKSLTDIYSFCEQLSQNLISTKVDFNDLSKDAQGICKNCSKVENIVTREAASLQESISSVQYEDNFRRQIFLKSVFRQAVDDVINMKESDLAIDKLYLKSGDSIVMLLNNSGFVTKSEEYPFLKDIVNIFVDFSVNVHRFYLGSTLECSKGMSLTIMRIDNQEVLNYLDDPCTAPGWTAVNQGLNGPLITENIISGQLRRKERLAPPIRGPRLSERYANILLFTTQFACNALISCENQLNIIDSERGNGDTGTRLKNISEVLLRRMRDKKLIMNYPFTFFESLSKLLEATVGGTSGCIYSILFEAVAYTFSTYDEKTEISPLMWLKAFEDAANALKKFGNVNYGDGTMYDPIYALLKIAREELTKGTNLIAAYDKAIYSAEQVAQLTKKKFRHPDSGAHAAVIWMRAVFEGVKLTCPVDYE